MDASNAVPPLPSQAIQCSIAFAQEREAWSHVSGRLPGTPDFDRVSWELWLAAVHKAGEAAKASFAATGSP